MDLPDSYLDVSDTLRYMPCILRWSLSTHSLRTVLAPLPELYSSDLSGGGVFLQVDNLTLATISYLLRVRRV